MEDPEGSPAERLTKRERRKQVMKWVTLAVLASVAVIWCASGFATPMVIRNPNIPLAPVKPRALTPSQLQAYEQAKAAQGPMPTGLVTLKATPATMEPRLKENPSGGTLNFKGQQGGINPLWGPNTTVFSGNLAYGGAGFPNKTVSFDFDTSGNFYATADTAPSPGNVHQFRILRSTDDGSTWQEVLFGSGFATIYQSKLIVAQTDSLFWYWFNVDSTGTAFVIRWNASAGSYTQYTLGSSMKRIAAAWDMDTNVPYFYVALLDNSGVVWYVRGTSQGTSWSAPAAVTYPGITSLDIAIGNATQVSNNIFMAITWATDSSAWCFYDSAGTWQEQRVSENDGQQCRIASIAASHEAIGDSVRVYITYTYAFNPSVSDYDIHESYNMQNGYGAWTKGYWLAATTDAEWGCSINIPNEASGSSFVNAVWYDDLGSSLSVKQDWLTNGYHNPESWNGATTVSDHAHTYGVYPYATGTLRHGGGGYWSVVLYPGDNANIYMSGDWFTTGVEQGGAQATPNTGFELGEARPNPLTNRTSIAFSLPRQGQVELAVYDVAGQKVTTLAKGTMTAGSHEVSFNGAEAPAGVYFYRLNFEGKTLTNRMVVVR
jgi:hypothetical protein